MQAELDTPNRIMQSMRITKLMLVLGVAVFSLLLPLPAHSQADFSALYEHIAPPVVRVDTPGIGSGTGFIAQYETSQGEIETGIITACHVVFDAARPFSNPEASPIVNITFDAWKPELTIRAAVVRCNAANDTALLLPVNENDEAVSMRTFFENLSNERQDPSFRGFPRLYFGDSDDVKPLDPVFVIGHPGPFSELNSVQGRVSGTLTVPHVVAESGRVDRIAIVIIYDGRPDRSIELGSVLSIQTLPALDLDELSELANDVFSSGHNLLLMSDTQPTGFRVTAWDAIEVLDGHLRVQERPVEFSRTLFGEGFNIGARLDNFGDVSLLRQFFRMDLPIVGGHSGAPVMNVSGQVIGMVEWGISGEPGSNFANIGNDVLKALFEDQ